MRRCEGGGANSAEPIGGHASSYLQMKDI